MAKITESKIDDKEGFDKAFDAFLTETDPELHAEAVGAMLETIDLDEVFYDLLEDTDYIEHFFLMWHDAHKENGISSSEKKALRDIGRLSQRYYMKRKYQRLYKLFFDMTFNNLLRFIDIEEHEDFNELTDVDLFEKHLIPSEIFLQFFLLEAPMRHQDFNWHRGDEITQQHLALLIVLFEDIYEFFHESNSSPQKTIT